MADNPFDQFDAAPAANPFDQFDAPQPEQKSTLRDVAEQIPQGFNRGVDALYNAPNNAVNFVARQLGYEPPITPVKLATRFNNEDDAPKTTAGRYAGAISEQLGGSALPMVGTVARGAEAVPAIINTLTSAAGAGTAGQVAKDAGLGPGWQLAATLAGGAAAPGAVNSAFSKGPPDPRMVEKTLAAQAAQQEGIDVPKAAVAGSLEKPVAGRLGSIPLVGAPINNAARTALDQTGDRIANIADAYGTGSRATAGTNLRDALVDYIDTGARAPMQRLYARVDNLVDQNMLHQLPATQRLAGQLMNVPSATMRNINQNALAPIAEDLAQPGLTYQGISQMRTAVGAMLDDRLAPNYGTMEPTLRRIYGALTDDLRGAVQRGGRPGAIQAFDQANAANAAIEARRTALQKIVGPRGDKSGENVFDSMIQMAQNKGKSADLSKLALARRSVDDQTWGDFTSGFIRRMGLDPKTDNFSPDRFLIEYGKLSPQGRNILFRGTAGQNDLAQSLDRMSRVSQQFSELYKMGNPSGTGGVGFLAGLFGVGTGLSFPIAWAGAGGMWGASKYFASPANVDRMTRTLQARMAYTRNPNPTTEQRLSQATSSLSNSLKQYQPSTNAQ